MGWSSRCRPCCRSRGRGRALEDRCQHDLALARGGGTIVAVRLLVISATVVVTTAVDMEHLAHGAHHGLEKGASGLIVTGVVDDTGLLLAGE